jgi:hypothetical protein
MAESPEVGVLTIKPRRTPEELKKAKAEEEARLPTLTGMEAALCHRRIKAYQAWLTRYRAAGLVK